MTNNQSLKDRIKINPVYTQNIEGKIDSEEVAEIESYFNNGLEDDGTVLMEREKCYSREFIESVIEYAKKCHHDVPRAIYNLIEKKSRRTSIICNI